MESARGDAWGREMLPARRGVGGVVEGGIVAEEHDARELGRHGGIYRDVAEDLVVRQGGGFVRRRRRPGGRWGGGYRG